MSSSSCLTNVWLGFNDTVNKIPLFYFIHVFKLDLIPFSVTAVCCLQHHGESKPVHPLNHLFYLLFCCFINSVLSNLQACWTSVGHEKQINAPAARYKFERTPSAAWWELETPIKSYGENLACSGEMKLFQKQPAAEPGPKSAVPRSLAQKIPSIQSKIHYLRRDPAAPFHTGTGPWKDYSQFSLLISLWKYEICSYFPTQREFCGGESIYPLIVTLIFFPAQNTGSGSGVAAQHPRPGTESSVPGGPGWERILPLYYTVRPGSDEQQASLITSTETAYQAKADLDLGM